MTVQLTVFDGCGLPFAKGSPTSRDAARKVAKDAKSHRYTLRNLVLSRGEYGATYKECMAATGLSSGTVCGRLNDLRGKPGRDGKPRQADYELVATVRKRNGDAVIVHRRFYGQVAA